MEKTISEDLFEDVLKGVSRSIYLSLRALPASVRRQMGLGYLFCRAADTIADTRLVARHQRLKHLDTFREQFEAPSPDPREAAATQAALEPRQDHPRERLLLSKLEDCFQTLLAFDETDRRLIGEGARGVVQGMQMDLALFQGESESQLSCLSTLEDLERYCHFIGGCPGLFWTKLCLRHIPSLRDLSAEFMFKTGIDFGKGLQMTNILRDVAADLRNGRCYIPQRELAREGLAPFDLLHPNAWPRLQPLYERLVADARALLDRGFSYILELPRHELRLRVACLWPLLIAKKTLRLLLHSNHVLDPHKTVKISRPELYQIMAFSTAAAPSNTTLTKLYKSFV